jgi:hypothetical protein
LGSCPFTSPRNIPKALRRGDGKLQKPAVPGMLKNKDLRMKGQAFQGIGPGLVLPVPCHGMAQPAKVGPDLVPAAGLQFQGQEGVALSGLKQFPAGKGLPAPGANHHPAAPVLPQGRIDDARGPPG